jgi:AraC family transcriptional regulator
MANFKFIDPPVTSINVQLLAGMAQEYDLLWGGKNISNNYSRLYMLRYGRGAVAYHDRTVELCPGRLYLFPENKTASYSCSGQMYLQWLHIRLEFLPGLSIFNFFDPPREITATTQMEAMFAGIFAGLDVANPAGLLMKYAAILNLIAGFLPENWLDLMPPKETLTRLNPVLELMRLNPGQEFDLKKLAGKVNLHPVYFSNLFRKTFGVSPLRYLTQLRLELAKNLLCSSGQSMAEISGNCGYNNEFFFARIFKKYTGVAPGRFRKGIQSMES